MRIVLVRTDRVGDLILSTPAITSMRRSFPQAHVTIVCSRYNSVVVERNADVDNIVTYTEGVKPYTFGRRLGDGFDLAIALAPRLADMAIAAGTRAPLRIGYTYVRRYLARLAARRYLTDILVSEADPALSDRQPLRIVRHEVDQVLALAERAGAHEIVRELVVPVGAAERAAVGNIPAGSVTIQLAPRWLTGGSTTKSLFLLIADLRQLGRPLVATFGPDASELGALVARSGLVHHVVGELPFLEWAALLERAGCVLTVDTGATHVASAMRRPTVVVFENRFFRLSSQEWSPYGVPARVLRKPPDEHPASLLRSRGEIVSAVSSLLALER